MPSRSPLVFPSEQRVLVALGERVRLARLRRKLSMETVAGRAGISRGTLYNVEAGEAGVTLGTYVRVLATLGLDGDLAAVAADDKVGRKLQDLGLEPSKTSRAPRRRTPARKPADEAAPPANDPAGDEPRGRR